MYLKKKRGYIMQLLILFIVLNIVNVILQTAKSIVTIKAGKVPAAAINGIAYGLYTILLIYINGDLPLMSKVLVVALSNLVGVYIVKLIEEKMRKDKLWKIEFSIKNKTENYIPIETLLKERQISFSSIPVGDYTVFNCYASTQTQSSQIKTIIDLYHAKYFVTESKIL